MRQLLLNMGRRVLAVIWLLLLTTFAAIIWLGATPAGTTFVVSELNNRFPERIYIQEADGTLFDGISFKKATFKSTNVEAEATDGELDWKLAHLIDQTLVFDQLSAKSLTINRIASPSPDSTSSKAKAPTIPEISSPLDVQIRNLELGQLVLKNEGKQQTRLAGIQAALEMQGSHVAISRLQLAYKDFIASGQGSVDLSGTQETNLNFSLTQKEKPGRLKLQVSGPLGNYRWETSSDLAPDSIPDYSLIANGGGNLSELSVATLALKTLDGEMKSTGEIQWWPALKAHMELEAKNLNPGVYREDLPGRLDFQGSLKLADERVDFQITGSGELQEHPFNFDTRGHYHEATLDLQQMDLSSAENKLSVSGQLTTGGHSDFEYELTAPELSRLHPELDGSLQGSGYLQGNLETPRMQASLTGKTLRWRRQTLGQLDLNIKPSSNALHNVDLVIEALSDSGRTLDELSINGLASLEEQNLTLSANTKKLFSASARINNKSDINAKKLSGVLTNTKVKLESGLSLSQDTPSPFELSKNVQQVAPLCLTEKEQKLCINADFRGQRGNASIELSAIPLAQLSQEIQSIKRTLNAQLDLHKTIAGWNLRSRGNVDTKASFDSDISLSKHNNLSGYLKADVPDLRWLELLSTTISEPEGRLNADLTLGGTLSKPATQGTITLNKASIKLPAYGTDLHDIQMSVAFASLDKATLDGQLNMGDATLSIDGSFEWTGDKNYSLELRAKGEELQVLNTHEAKVWISPDLNLNSDAKNTLITGNVSVPKAEITPAELPAQAARVSDDEEIISANKPPKTNGKTLPIEINVGVKIGNESERQKVLFEGFGLTTELKGQLQISQLPRKPLLGDGNIRMIDGYYKAYGQDLAIQKGQIFFNGPLDNPGFSIEAVREAGDIKAGIRVSGTVESPQSTLFSTPTLSDTDTLSYLLTGQSFNRDSSNESSNETNPMLLLAATRWGLKAGGGIIEDIQKTTGIDTFKLSSEDDINQSALLIGKYLTPKLYIQYAMKLFEETDLFSLNYMLTPSLSLEAESGSSQGLNLIYRLERD